MKRRTFLKDAAAAALGAAALSAPGLRAATRESAPDQPSKGVARNFLYRPDGTFKVLQLTDTHYIWGDERSDRAYRNVCEMLDAEQPDLVIHTGDIVFGTPAAEAARAILAPMAERGIPFAVALGNHDGEYDLSRAELYEAIVKLPGCINTPAVKDVWGDSNDVITLSGPGGVERVLYLFDSGNYNEFPGCGYGYVHFSQIAWYRAMSRFFTERNGGKAVPSLAFMHIPPREFEDGLCDVEHHQMAGNCCESPCPSNFNSGLALNFREMGDVGAVVCGHDHDDDFAMLYHDLFFIYGRFSGCDTVYNNLGPSGCRVFEFTRGQAGFRTWVRLYGGTVEQELRLVPGMKHLFKPDEE